MKAFVVLLSLVAVAVHVWLSRNLHDGPNEELLATPLQQKLQPSHEDVVVSYDYLDAILEGEVSSEEARRSVSAEARSIQPIGRIVNKLTIKQTPASLLARLTDGTLTLSGILPDQQTGKQLTAAMEKLRFTRIKDQIKIKPDASKPVWLEGIAEFTQDFFSDTGAGELEIGEESVRLAKEIGAMREKEIWTNAAAKLFPEGEYLDQLSFPSIPRPFDLGIKEMGNDLNLTGWLPDLDLKNRILAEAGERFPEMNIMDQISVAPNVEIPEWGANLPRFLGEIPESAKPIDLAFNSSGIQAPRLGKTLELSLRKLAMNTMGDSFPKVESPQFELTIRSTGQDLDIDGWLPDDGLKSEFVSALETRFPNLQLTDQTGIDPDLSIPDWVTVIPGFLGSLPDDFDLSEIKIDRQGFDLTSLPRNERLIFRRTLSDTLGSKYPRFKLPDFELDLVPGEDSLKLSGWLADADMKSKIAEAVGNRFPNRKIENTIEIDPDITAPEWADQLHNYLGELPDLNGVPGVKFDSSGIELPELSKSDQVAWDRLSAKWLGGKYAEWKAPEFGLDLKRDGKALTASGWLPSNELKKKTIDSLRTRFPDWQIIDDIGVDRQMKAPDWLPKLPSFLTSLPEWQGINGFHFDNKGIGMKGFSDAQKVEFGTLAMAQLGPQFPRIDLPAMKVPESPKPPSGSKPMTGKPAATVTAILKNKTVVLSGSVPAESLKKSLGESAAKALPGAEVVNKIKHESAVAESPWNKNIASYLAEFLQDSPASAELEIDGKSLRVKRQINDKKAKQQLLANAKSMFPSVEIVDQISIREKPKMAMTKESKKPTMNTPVNPPGKQGKAPEQNRHPSAVVYFATSSFWVDPEGNRRIAETAEELNRLGRDFKVQVKGYADSTGDAYANKVLSRKRAEAVVAKLVSNGLERSRVQIQSVGDTQSQGGDLRSDRKVEIFVVPKSQ